jgi:hypothetical protein
LDGGLERSAIVGSLQIRDALRIGESCNLDVGGFLRAVQHRCLLRRCMLSTIHPAGGTDKNTLHRIEVSASGDANQPCAMTRDIDGT